MNKIKAFIFDLDGTLLDSMPYWRLENRLVMESCGYPVDGELAKELRVVTCGYVAEKLSKEGFKTADEVYAEYLRRMTIHYLNDVCPKPGAPEFLRLLASNGIKIYLASATDSHVTRKALAHFGMLDCFTDVFDDTTFGIPKSVPEFFIRLAERAGIKPGECALFEDSAYAMNSARKNGLSIWGISDSVAARIPGRPEEVRAASDYYVNDFYEAARLFVNCQ